MVDGDAPARIFGSLGARLVSGRFDSAGKIVRARAPLLFFHGDRDEIITYDLERRLFGAAETVPKILCRRFPDFTFSWAST